MNKTKTIHTVLKIIIAFVWIANGLFCKVLNMVPRHQLIVARILGPEHAQLLTKMIGVSEILMAVWILSRIKPKLCAVTQMFVIALMNTIEFILAPDLLLFGHINAIVATAFINIIYINQFILGRDTDEKILKFTLSK